MSGNSTKFWQNRSSLKFGDKISSSNFFFILNPAGMVVMFLDITGANLFGCSCEMFVFSPVFEPDFHGLERNLAAFAEIGTFSGFKFFIDGCRFVDEKDDFGWVEFDCLKLFLIKSFFSHFFNVKLERTLSYFSIAWSTCFFSCKASPSFFNFFASDFIWLTSWTLSLKRFNIKFYILWRKRIQFW